jgi:prophage antirepressor-like protein
VVEIDCDAWFVAKDVARVLGYRQTDKAVRDHCNGAQRMTVANRDSQRGGAQFWTIIPERDVYRLIMRSKLPAAEAFEDWVVGTVLPAIRKDGIRDTACEYQLEQSASNLPSRQTNVCNAFQRSRYRTSPDPAKIALDERHGRALQRRDRGGASNHHFQSGEQLETTLHRYVWLYNQQLPQSALSSKTPLQAMKDWPSFFHRSPH